MEHTRWIIITRIWIMCVITILFFIILAPSAFAKETLCDCWCQTNGGAVPQGKLSSSDACQSLCKKNTKKDMATCAYNLEQYPASNLRCFTKEFCELKDKDGKIKGEFDTKFQPPECLAGQHYCYPNPDNAEKLKLNIAIGNKLEIGNLGEYINTMYAWMLGAGITFAIVMAMVGGMQYVLAAGSGDVGKGKEKIINAVVGIILLSATYLILLTVNPQLLKLQVPRLPMLKQVDLIKNSSCGDLEASGYVIKDKENNNIPSSEKKCGTLAKVVSKKDGTPVVEGTTCQYMTCSDEETKAGKVCLGSGKKADCVSCKEVFLSNSKVSPSSQTCTALKRPDTKITINSKVVPIKNYCFYSHDPAVIVSATKEAAFYVAVGASAALSGPGALVVGAVLTADMVNDMATGTCAEISLNCSKVTKCEDYDTEDAESGITKDDMEDFFISDLWGDMNLKKLCEENPCSSLKGGNVNSSCVYTSTSETYGTPGKNDCVSTKQAKAKTCDADACKALGKFCVEFGGFKQCASCEEITKDNKILGGDELTPSIEVCAQASKKVKDKDFCGFTTDSDADGPSCAHVIIDCNKITPALAGNACDAYDKMQVINKEDKDTLDMFGPYEGTGGNFSLKHICEKDPCGAAKIEGKSACEYKKGMVFADACD